jgi:integrase
MRAELAPRVAATPILSILEGDDSGKRLSAAPRSNLEVLNGFEHVGRTKAIDSLLTKEEFLAMLQAGKSAKDKAILCLAVVGLRASEISNVKRHWCDMSNRTIKIPPVFAKRRKGRIVPFGNLRIVSEVLIAFFALEPNGVALTRIAIWQRIKRMASAASVTHPVTPHGLRATGATWLAMAGYSITGLMDHFGWSELRTAQHYVRASGASAMRDMQEKGPNVL